MVAADGISDDFGRSISGAVSLDGQSQYLAPIGDSQVKEGFTKIPNSLLDFWLRELSGTEFKILMWLGRKSFGFHQKEVTAGMRRIASSTGLHLATVSAAVSELRNRGVIRCVRGCRGRITYEINCSKIPNSECSGKQNSDCSKTSNTYKETVIKKPHHQRNKQEYKQSRRAEAYMEPPKPTIPPTAPSFRVDDEFLSEKKRSPEQEFLLWLSELHRGNLHVDPPSVLRIVRTKLDLVNVPFADYLQFAKSRTTGKVRTGGHYVNLAQELVCNQQSAALAQSAAVRAGVVMETARCPKCGGCGYLEQDNYCDCPMGADLARVDRRSAAQKLPPSDALPIP